MSESGSGPRVHVIGASLSSPEDLPHFINAIKAAAQTENPNEALRNLAGPFRRPTKSNEDEKPVDDDEKPVDDDKKPVAEEKVVAPFLSPELAGKLMKLQFFRYKILKSRRLDLDDLHNIRLVDREWCQTVTPPTIEKQKVLNLSRTSFSMNEMMMMIMEQAMPEEISGPRLERVPCPTGKIYYEFPLSVGFIENNSLMLFIDPSKESCRKLVLAITRAEKELLTKTWKAAHEYDDKPDKIPCDCHKCAITKNFPGEWKNMSLEQWKEKFQLAFDLDNHVFRMYMPQYCTCRETSGHETRQVNFFHKPNETTNENYGKTNFDSKLFVPPAVFKPLAYVENIIVTENHLRFVWKVAQVHCYDSVIAGGDICPCDDVNCLLSSKELIEKLSSPDPTIKEQLKHFQSALENRSVDPSKMNVHMKAKMENAKSK